jgi:hypothetical protein
VDLILHGHTHREEFAELARPQGRPIPVVGTGSASYSGPLERCSRYNIYEIQDRAVTAITYAHDAASNGYREARRRELESRMRHHGAAVVASRYRRRRRNTVTPTPNAPASNHGPTTLASAQEPMRHEHPESPRWGAAVLVVWAVFVDVAAEVVPWVACEVCSPVAAAVAVEVFSTVAAAVVVEVLLSVAGPVA